MTTAVTYADVVEAAELIRPVAIQTPLEYSRVLSDLVGAPVYLKCENLQRTGSFKVRGAYVRMSRLTPAEKATGVVAASAGNHAQGVALAASELGIRATIFMPADASLPKVAATREYGAEVRLIGANVADALEAARCEAERTGAVFIHPYDHRDIIAGQGTIAMEIREQMPDVATVVAPIGGGGLAAGLTAGFAEPGRTAVCVVGVQASNADAYTASFVAGHPVTVTPRSTMADGIAVSTPGTLPFEMLRDADTEVRNVSEDELSRALLEVIERQKLVVEPAGAAGVAAVMAHPGSFEGGPVCIVLSGGNVDPIILLRIIRHGLASAGRYLQLRVRLQDKPGALAALVVELAREGGNVMHIDHVRTGTDLAIDEVEVVFQVETKGVEHCAQLLGHLKSQGYVVVDGNV